MTRSWIATAVMGCVSLAMVWAFLYVPPSPYVPTGGDSVDPVVSRADGVVYVTRRYEITRETPFRVSRRMVSGTCPVNCEVIDMTTSELFLKPGVYERRRPHVIPHQAGPGLWTLTFFIHYEDRLGRTITVPMPSLTIEVVK